MGNLSSIIEIQVGSGRYSDAMLLKLFDITLNKGCPMVGIKIQYKYRKEMNTT